MDTAKLNSRVQTVSGMVGPANSNFPRIFDTQHGRDRWAVYTAGFSDPITALGDSIPAALGPPSCSPLVEAILTADDQKSVEAEQ